MVPASCVDVGRVRDRREQRTVLAHQVEDRRVVDAVARWILVVGHLLIEDAIGFRSCGDVAVAAGQPDEARREALDVGRELLRACPAPGRA